MTAKHRDRLAEAERRRKELAAKHDEDLERAVGEQRALHDENKMRKVVHTSLLAILRRSTTHSRGKSHFSVLRGTQWLTCRGGGQIGPMTMPLEEHLMA